MAKIAMFIAFQGFRDEEYLEPKKIFDAAEIQADVFSTAKGLAKGKFGAAVEVEKRIEEAKIEDYDAFCLVGGPGCLEHLDNEKVCGLFSSAHSAGKLIAAICISPVILAHAGLLKGKRVTVWPDGAEDLKKAGAECTGGEVEMDGKIITASGPEAARGFAKKILEMLKGE